MSEKRFTLTEESSGKSIDLPIRSGTHGPDMVEVGSLYKEHGVFTYDPGYGTTGSCSSAITFIDGEKGVLLFRGYPIEQLAENCSFIEVTYLLLYGELPTKDELEAFEKDIRHHTMVPESLNQFFNGFHYDAHPMSMLMGTVGSLSAFYHDRTDIKNPHDRDQFARRMIAKIPTIAAAAYKHSVGQPVVYPNNDLDYCSNFLNMLFAVPAERYEISPTAAKALDLLFILHADHEQNASTSTVRLSGSAGTNPYAAIAAGISTLWGPAHGGANEAVLRMLEEIGSADRCDEYIAKAKDKDDPFRLMGFGHRVYKNFDPRATIIRKACHEVLEELGVDDPLLELAMKLEEAALKDEYFVSKKLYPNVDFYSGIIYKALGFPTNMFTVLFAIARTVGWVAHWAEGQADPEARIGRPRQNYIGEAKRDVVDIAKR